MLPDLHGGQEWPTSVPPRLARHGRDRFGRVRGQLLLGQGVCQLVRARVVHRIVRRGSTGQLVGEDDARVGFRELVVPFCSS